MKFIIPQNYNFKSKVFGMLDYSTIVLNIVWYTIMFFIFHLLFKNWNIKIFFIISFCFPMTLFSIFGFYGEPMFFVISYLLKYLLKPKLYLFKKF